MSQEAEDEVIPVIAVVDGPGGPDQGSITRSWFDFRQRWPLRPFCLLRLEGADELLIPANLLRDDNKVYETVNRDGDDEFKRSDWFDLCNIEDLCLNSVALLIDTNTPVVGSSHAYFQQRMKEANGGKGFEILYATPQDDNNWIEPLDIMWTSSNAPSMAPTDQPSFVPSMSPTMVGTRGNEIGATVFLICTFRSNNGIPNNGGFSEAEQAVSSLLVYLFTIFLSVPAHQLVLVSYLFRCCCCSC